MHDMQGMDRCTDVLSREGDTEFVLSSEQRSIWITVDDVSVHIRRTEEGGVRVSLYPLDGEMGDPLDECGVIQLVCGDPKSWRVR